MEHNKLIDTYISNTSFHQFADIVITKKDDVNNKNIFLKNQIIFCKADFLFELFNYIRYSNKKYILITQLSDYSVDSNIFLNKPPCIKKWFGRNSNFIHEDLIPIPIGIPAMFGPDAIDNPQIHPTHIINNSEIINNKLKINDVVYCNWMNHTNNYRNNVINDIKKTNVKIQYEQNLDYETYCNNMSNYKFVISPPGNGIDCHRTWEALHMGCYPIVIKHFIYDTFKNLPIIQVNNYSEISNDFLKYHLEKKYDLEKLNINYWKDLIFNEFNKIKDAI